MLIRKTRVEDMEQVLSIYLQAKAYFKENHIDQWQDAKPNRLSLESDMAKGHSYVLVDHERIIGTFYYAIEIDSNYSYIENGSFLSNGPYGLLHRIAIDNAYKGKNLSKHIIAFMKEDCLKKGVYSLRLDTQKDNLSMQRMVTKHGFIYCGNIYLDHIHDDHHMRYVYEYLLNQKEN